MPYTRITASKNGREAIEYALNGKGHDGSDARNVYVTAVGMYGDNYAEQMQAFWKKASRKNLNQVRRIIISFSKEELDPNDPKSALIAAEIAREEVENHYKDRQALICIQNDGVGGCLHAHCIVSNVSMTDFKGCTDEQTKFHYVAQTVDDIAKKYINLSMDYDDKFDRQTGKMIVPKDVVQQNERRMRDENNAAVAKGEDAPNYIWKDDLKNRICAAMNEATSRDDYLKRLTAHGVEAEYKYSRKQGDYILYELTDTTGFTGKIPQNLKSKSYKLGTNYGIETLDAVIGNAVHISSDYAPAAKLEPTLPDIKPTEPEELEMTKIAEPKAEEQTETVKISEKEPNGAVQISAINETVIETIPEAAEQPKIEEPTPKFNKTGRSSRGIKRNGKVQVEEEKTEEQAEVKKPVRKFSPRRTALTDDLLAKIRRDVDMLNDFENNSVDDRDITD